MNARRKVRAYRIACSLAVVILAGVSNSCDAAGTPTVLTLATTTSVANSGLLEPLSQAFRDERGIELRSHLAGSGLALRMMSSGDVDVVISHAPALEAAALREHPSWRYRKIMYNDFVLVGPPDDPARVRDAGDIAVAMRQIASSPQVRFLSRGDRSGTHEREEALWVLARARPPAERLVVAGAGMGATLRIAGETAAYTLTDRATYAQLASTVRLAILFEGGASLLNTYAVIVDSAGPLTAAATAFADWLVDGNGRGVIDRYRVGAGVPAFTVWPRARNRERPDDMP